jgi:hypothetical protein
MKQLFYSFAAVLASLSVFLKMVLGFGLHGYTVWFAYHVSGLGAAAATLFFPPFAEAFWIFDYYHVTGIFWSEIAIGSAAYIAMYGFLMICAVLASSLEPTTRSQV